MLTKTATQVYRCAHCQGERLRKNGHSTGGAQRAFCRDCERTFVLEPKPPRHGAQEREKILAAATQERLSRRAIELSFGPVFRTVRRWAQKKAGELPALEGTLLPAQRGDVLELDELWSFVGSKTWGICWVWVALCRRSGQLVAFTLGDRSQEAATRLRAEIPKAYRRCAARSDQHQPYANAFAKRTHRLCQKKQGQTNHAESFWGALRQRASRLVRRARSFSKRFDMHELWLQLFFTRHNLGLQH